MKAALPISSQNLARTAVGVATSVAAVAIVTAAIFALESVAPVLSLGVLYVFAVLPIAVLFGLAYALPVSVASMLAFNWFFLPPRQTNCLGLTDSRTGCAQAHLSGHGSRRQRPRCPVTAPRG